MKKNPDKRFVIGISTGDPAGIGPEICIKALSQKNIYQKAIPVVFSDAVVLEDALKLTGKKLKLNVISEPASAKGKPGTIDFLDAALLQKGDYSYGKLNAASGEASFRYVESLIKNALDGKLDAIVTGPINKEAVNLAGHSFSGHTEILAHFAQTKNYTMLLSAGNLNVFHVSTHVSLKEACNLVKKERICQVINLAELALKLMGKKKRRIAVAALNPHSSENGLFGNEEKMEIIPAIESAKKDGLDISGPVPPDTVFVQAIGGIYDAVIAMYHDQGHIPLKLCGFKIDPATGLFSQMSGVNATIGLPVIRTSVDHGTAFDKAGKNISSEGSLLDAIKMAVTFAENKKKGV